MAWKIFGSRFFRKERRRRDRWNGIMRVAGKVSEQQNGPPWARIAAEMAGTYHPGDLWTPDRMDLPFPSGSVQVTVESLAQGETRINGGAALPHTRWSAKVPVPRHLSFRVAFASILPSRGGNEPISVLAMATLRDPLVHATLQREHEAWLVLEQSVLDCRVPGVVTDRDRFLCLTELFVAARGSLLRSLATKG